MSAEDDRARVELLEADNARLRAGVREAAATLVRWAVAFGGNTPMAIVASSLRVLVGDEKPPVETHPCSADGKTWTPCGKSDAECGICAHMRARPSEP